MHTQEHTHSHMHTHTRMHTQEHTHTSTCSFFISMQRKHVLRLQIAGFQGETQMEGRLTDDRQTEGQINERHTATQTGKQAADNEAGR